MGPRGFKSVRKKSTVVYILSFGKIWIQDFTKNQQIAFHIFFCQIWMQDFHKNPKKPNPDRKKS
jgi:hypothetical protein